MTKYKAKNNSDIGEILADRLTERLAREWAFVVACAFDFSAWFDEYFPADMKKKVTYTKYRKPVIMQDIIKMPACLSAQVDAGRPVFEMRYVHANVSRMSFRKPVLKMLVVALIVGMNWAGLSAVGETVAVFGDTEMSGGNSFIAATFDFSITNNEHDIFLGVTLGEDYSFASVLTKHVDSLSVQYKVSADELAAGDPDFCDVIKLEALHASTDFDGSILDLAGGPTPSLGTWAFELDRSHLSTSIAHGATCNVDFVFYGWRDGIAKELSGFDDEERVQMAITSRMIVLNEFLPKPDGEAYGFDFGSDSSDMPQGEWVEIYNNSDHDFDVAGWYIWDASGSEANKIYITAGNTAPAGTTVGAHSWLVVYMNKAVLNNTGDTVKLFDDTDRLVDEYTYSGSDYCELEPTPGDENETSTSGECSEVPSNKSYARIPDGIGAFVDPVPTPGYPNTEDEEDGAESLNAFIDSKGGDFEAPVITVNPANPAYVPLGSTYSDNGATVEDNVDANLGVNPVDVGLVDTNTLGTYYVSYFAIDNAGNKGEAFRTVIVYDPALGILVLEEEIEEPAINEGDETLVAQDAKEEETVSEEEITEFTNEGTGGGQEDSSEEPKLEEPEEEIVTDEVVDEEQPEENPEVVVGDVIEDDALVIKEGATGETAEEPADEEVLETEDNSTFSTDSDKEGPSQQEVVEETIKDEEESEKTEDVTEEVIEEIIEEVPAEEEAPVEEETIEESAEEEVIEKETEDVAEEMVSLEVKNGDAPAEEELSEEIIDDEEEVVTPEEVSQDETTEENI